MVLGSCTSLQFGAAVATGVMTHIGPGLTTASRLLIASALLLMISRPRFLRYPRDEWIALAYFGIAMAGMNGFFYAAIARIPLGLAVTIEFAGPLLLAAVLSHKRRDLVCVATAAVAIVALCLGRSGLATAHLDGLGVLFALMAATFWALYIVTGKNLSRRVPGRGALAVGLFIAAAAVMPFGVGSLPQLAAQPHLLWALLAVEQVVFFVAGGIGLALVFLQHHRAQKILGLGVGLAGAAYILQQFPHLVITPHIGALVFGNAVPLLEHVLDEELVAFYFLAHGNGLDWGK
mgnify:CR=1 FL=1